MKKILILITIIFAINVKTDAHDFSAVNNGKNIYYRITSATLPRTVSVTYEGSTYNSNTDEYSGSVTIPDSVLYNDNYYKVTSIGYNAFYDCHGLTSITIPNSVTSIGIGAFYNCWDLTSVNIPNSVTDIEGASFYNCGRLTSLIIGSSVSYIGDEAFSICSSLSSIVVLAIPFALGNNTFYGVDKNIPVIVPCDWVPFYQDNTFWSYFTNINCIDDNDSIFILDGIRYQKIITNESSLKVKVINNFPLYSDTISIPTTINYNANNYSVTEISNYAFSGCTDLKTVIIPNSITNIGKRAFLNCKDLASLSIGNGVTSIGYESFSDCRELTSVTIPNSVTTIGDRAFHGCRKINNLIIGNNVTSIGELAFSESWLLTSVKIPNSVTNIGSWAFGASGLTSLIIGSSVNSIGTYAFYCSGLTSITSLSIIPPILGGNVFKDVNKTIPLYVSEASIPLYQAADGWQDFFNIQTIGIANIESANDLEILMFPNPMQGETKIKIDNLNSKVDVIVLDIMGKVVKRGVIDKGQRELELDLSGYAKGVYNIRIVNDRINQTKKLIVQ